MSGTPGMRGEGGLTIITPSFRGDLPLFARLHQSLSVMAGPEVHHLVVVPGRDRGAFAPFAGPRTRIVPEEEVLPTRFWRLPKAFTRLTSGRNIWLTTRTLPIRGWILQQILKVAAPALAETEALLFADSDVFFLRPVTADALWRDGRLRLTHEAGVTGHFAAHRKWYASAERLLGVARAGYFGDNYVADLITWRRSNVLGFRAFLEQRYGRPWWVVLGNTLHFSEYTLYGIYVDHVLKEGGGHWRTPEYLAHASWGYAFDTAEQRMAFLDDVKPHHLACSLQSQSGIPLEIRNELLDEAARRLWPSGALP